MNTAEAKRAVHMPKSRMGTVLHERARIASAKWKPTIFDIRAGSGGQRPPDDFGLSGSGGPVEPGADRRPGGSGGVGPPENATDEKGESPDPRRHFAIARAIADRSIREARLDDIAMYGADLARSDRMNQVVETGKAIFLLELIENPQAEINLHRVAAAAISPDDMRAFEAESERKGESRNPLMEIPAGVEGMLDAYRRNQEFVRLELDELQRTKRQAEQLEEFFFGAGEIKSQADIYNDDVLYAEIMRRAYNYEVAQFIQGRRSIVQLNLENEMNEQLLQYDFTPSMRDQLRDQLRQRSLEKVMVQARRIWQDDSLEAPPDQ